MKSILEELFYGNVCPSSDCRSKDGQTKKLMEHLANHHEKLNNTLTDKQKEKYKEFIEKPRTLDDFKVGLTVPSKLVPMCIKGGVILKEVDFTLRDI